jgi:hypothetical protein
MIPPVADAVSAPRLASLAPPEPAPPAPATPTIPSPDLSSVQASGIHSTATTKSHLCVMRIETCLPLAADAKQAEAEASFRVPAAQERDVVDILRSLTALHKPKRLVWCAASDPE